MKKSTVLAGVLAAAFLIAAGGEVFAGNGQGGGQRLRDGSCISAPGSSTSSPKRDRLRDGSCRLTQSGKASQGRTLGPGDGTGNDVPPLDGTGYGSPFMNE